MYSWTHPICNIHKNLQCMIQRYKVYSTSAKEAQHLGSSQLGTLVGLKISGHHLFSFIYKHNKGNIKSKFMGRNIRREVFKAVAKECGGDL